ncbi:hypothetical protein PYCCODRAFT_19984 [Trametes coccinea BRFM310]|uniref:Uncharacterized protein n=1 Tax=Trametes coccinea (strain BRFM310) TaxID=1353009 RepID=A0A1Y2J6K9_TRAC3|nr:hypothetical protein PYCCODRAFT_19984 [Trametes coccinea BRFM310]
MNADQQEQCLADCYMACNKSANELIPLGGHEHGLSMPRPDVSARLAEEARSATCQAVHGTKSTEMVTDAVCESILRYSTIAVEVLATSVSASDTTPQIREAGTSTLPMRKGIMLGKRTVSPASATPPSPCPTDAGHVGEKRGARMQENTMTDNDD